MSESTSWSTLRKYILRDMVNADVQRIEDKFASGIPDSNLCWQGIEAWLEGKQMRALPVRGNTIVRHGLRQDQCTWLTRRAEAGGNTFVWLRVNNVGWWLFKNDFQKLVDGVTKQELLEMPYHKKTVDMVQELKRLLLVR